MAGRGRPTKAEQIRRNQEAAGIPDSKPFTAKQRTKSGEDRILDCHINGVLIRNLQLDPQVLSALDYWLTDEGMAERNQRPNVREPSGVKVGKDGFAKALDQRRDDMADRGLDGYESRDPLKEVADRHAVAGMRPKFLSSSRVKDLSGAGDYAIVKDAAGDPVKVRGLVLGHMPEEKARARNRHYQDRGKKLLDQMTEEYRKSGGSTAVVDKG